MPTLGNNKATLFSQIDRTPNIQIKQLAKLLHTYDDLRIEDFKGHISDLLYEQLEEAGRDPQEKELWNRIAAAPLGSPAAMQDALRLITSYLQQFPTAKMAAEASAMQSRLQGDIDAAIRAEQERKREEEERKRREENLIREQSDWEKLERGNYNALLNYRSKYPSSAHLAEIDDLMWTNTKNAPSRHSLSRYICDWPSGQHADEARRALESIDQWEEIKHSNDIFRVDDFRDNNPDSPFINEVNSLYYQLRDKELQNMKANPSKYDKETVTKLIDADIFTQWQLEDEGLVTKESWETMQFNRKLLPEIQNYQIEDPNIQASAGCTDIFLFGTPGTGKTCLLMGLAGANGQKDDNGQGYTLNMRAAGGPYASALQQYLIKGITPGRTFGKFVTTINGEVEEKDRHNNILSHKINLVEMSGEEFALRISESQEVTLANMGTGATNLLRNNNRKTFFIIVDSTNDAVEVKFLESVRDAAGNVIDERIRTRYISQLDILNKFVSLFALPENQDIMQNVDAIHFVVTKADFLGNPDERGEKARELLLTKYAGPVALLKSYCRQTRRINFSTNYSPKVFTFSLGKFYLGDIFRFDPTETMQIVDVIRSVTGSVRERTWVDKLRDVIG